MRIAETAQIIPTNKNRSYPNIAIVEASSKANGIF